MAQLLSGAGVWKDDSIILWVVTFITRGRAIESALAMTHATLFIYVILIECLPGDSMVKRRRAPGAMAVIAVAAQPFKRHLSVTVATALVLVEASKQPASAAVVKRIGLWLVFGPMTALASAGCPGSQIHIALVTSNTRPVRVTGSAQLHLLSIACVAARTAGLVMTLDTPETKAVCVFAMTKHDLPAG